MKKGLFFIIAIGIVCIFFRQFFLNNLLPTPSDDIIGLYHPFRDFYAKDYPRGVPYKNFLITDPIRQQYPWRFESIIQEKMLQLPLWNPYNFSGAPLLANQQSAVFYPLNILFFLLPFSLSWSFLIMLQPLLAIIFLYFFLRNLRIDPVASIFGAVAYGFSGFFVSWLEWGTLDHVALWLPLLLLSIDKIFSEKNKTLWYSIYVFALLSAFFAGHLQTFFYVFLAVHIYLLCRWWKAKQKLEYVIWGACFGFLALVISSVQWMPLMQLIIHSAREADFVITDGWYLPWQHLVGFFSPDFFGNPTTLNYWGVWNYGELSGYIGIPAIFFVLYSLINRHDKKTWFFAGISVVALLFALPTPVAFLPIQLHIPFFATSQPTRLLVLVDFSFAVLAALGMDYFVKQKNKIIFPTILLSVVFVGLWIGVTLHSRLLPVVSLENIQTAKHNLVFPTGIFIVTVFLLISAFFLKKIKNIFYGVVIAILLLGIIDNLRFADKFTPFTNKSYLFPSTKSIQFLQSQKDLFRIMETDSRILPPNFSLMYHVQSVDGYDPLYIKEYGELIAASERGKADIHSPFGFNRIIQPQNYNSKIIDMLGVTYVISLNEISSAKLTKVYEEGETKIYKNSQAFPRAFFVKSIQPVLSDQQAINFIFSDSVNVRNEAAVKGIAKASDNLGIGLVEFLHYGQNKVEIHTENQFDGFLVLSDVYYPTWRAYIDDKETKIFPTDLALRGIFVSKGSHRITFSIGLY